MNNDSNPRPAVKRSGGVGFGMVDSAIIRDESLPLAVKWVYAYLTTFCSDVRSAYPSRARIARGTDMSVRRVDGALKIAEEVGLITIERRRHGKVNETSVYYLHDLGGSYVVGSGPKGVAQELHQEVAQDLHEGGAEAAPEQDHVSRPSPIKTISTSSDAACGPLAAGEARPNSVQTTLKGKIDLRIPDNYVDMSEGMAMNQLIRSAFGALKKVGYVPAPDMRSRLTAGLRNTLDRGYSLEALYDLTVTSLEQIGGDGWWGDLAYPVRTEERKAS